MICVSDGARLTPSKAQIEFPKVHRIHQQAHQPQQQIESFVNATVSFNKMNWIIFDGPVDKLWIESLNVELVDSKSLCILIGKKIKFTSSNSLIIEDENLIVVSSHIEFRYNIVYFDLDKFSWRADMKSWIEAIPSNAFSAERKKSLTENMQEMEKYVHIQNFSSPTTLFRPFAVQTKDPTFSSHLHLSTLSWLSP
ncbi:MAG: hypothetical protein EZS28_012846 [Streblomastix strix]|uniref:Dynein heavy chain n=1 Tax=Streblomastix strix TaxID=222440 RepID=A0A5J4W9S4_9EUKA|nr:MAG: hypothetical protein EZS28_012846 [Streblomastix strix]